MRFSHKILLLPALALTAFAALLIVNETARQNNERLMARIQSHAPALGAAREAEAMLKAVQNQLRDAAEAADPDGLAAADRSYMDLVVLLQKSQSSPAFQPGEVFGVRETLSQYYGSLRRLTERMIAGESVSAIDVGTAQERYRDVHTRLAAVREHQRVAVDEALGSAAANQRSSALTMSAIIAFALALLAGLSTVLARYVRRTLGQAMGIADRVSRGDLSSVVLSTTKDEFGVLLAALARMTEYLKGIAAVADRIAGDEARAEAASASGGLDTALSKMVDAEARVRHLIESVGAIVWRREAASGRFVFVSGAQQVLGCPSRRWVETPEFWQRRVHPQDLERAEATMAGATPESGQELEYRMFACDGRTVWLHGFVRLVRGPEASGELVGVFLDVTHRRQVEEALEQREHQLNEAERPARLILASDITERRRLEQQLRQARVLDLNLIVGDMQKMLQRLIGEQVLLRTKLSKEIGYVKADAGQLEQVMMNLVVNARDAMPGGGTVYIETRMAELDEAYASAHGCRSGRHVMLAVTDTGVGIQPEILPQIFEPFFTTKDPRKGTGLGLSTVYGIVAQGGGHIDVYSEVGKGTTFKVYLPAESSSSDADTRIIAASPPRGTETVLLARTRRR